MHSVLNYISQMHAIIYYLHAHINLQTCASKNMQERISSSLHPLPVQPCDNLAQDRMDQHPAIGVANSPRGAPLRRAPLLFLGVGKQINIW